MKRRVILFCVAMVLLAQPFAIKADGFDWDWSQAIQIEALVQLHKKTYYAEVDALSKIADSELINNGIENKSADYADVTDILSKKNDNINSILIAANLLAGCAMKIPKLIQEYQDFIVVADEAMRINPQLSDIVVVTNEKVAEELSHCYKSLAHIGLISSAILKASPDEKVNAAMQVADALGNTRNIIAKAKYKCRAMSVLPVKKQTDDPNTIKLIRSDVAREITESWTAIKKR